MNSILYVLKKEFKNKWKKAVRKPSFYVYVLILVFYAVMMYQTFRGLVVDGGFGTPKVLTMVLTGLVLYFTPMNYVAYAKHKGLRFLPAHVHFMFPAPVSPKFLMLPIIDTLSAILRRTLKGMKFMEADKSHIHHLLMRQFGHRNTVIIMCGLTALFF